MPHRTVRTVRLDCGINPLSFKSSVVPVCLSDSGGRFPVRTRRGRVRLSLVRDDESDSMDFSAGLRDKFTSQFVTLKSKPISLKSSAFLSVRIGWWDAAALSSGKCRIGQSELFRWIEG